MVSRTRPPARPARSPRTAEELPTDGTRPGSSPSPSTTAAARFHLVLDLAGHLFCKPPQTPTPAAGPGPRSVTAAARPRSRSQARSETWPGNRQHTQVRVGQVAGLAASAQHAGLGRQPRPRPRSVKVPRPSAGEARWARRWPGTRSITASAEITDPAAEPFLDGCRHGPVWGSKLHGAL